MRALTVVPIVMAVALSAAAQQPAKPPAPAPAASQTPAPAPAQPPAPARPAAPAAPGGAAQAPAAPAAAPAPNEAYTYNPEGRRDPFVSLVGTGLEPDKATPHTGVGPASLQVAEISVRGVLQSRGTLVAMVLGPDNKTYIVHQGDKFQDGTIKAITPQGLIIVQEVNDPLSLVKQREVRKLLRSLEDAKE
jgi:Tfp pilus assembly protein PilP